jgi:hypothetical protein
VGDLERERMRMRIFDRDFGFFFAGSLVGVVYTLIRDDFSIFVGWSFLIIAVGLQHWISRRLSNGKV